MKILRVTLLMVMCTLLLQSCASINKSTSKVQETQNSNNESKEFYTPEQDEKRLADTQVKESKELPNVLLIGDSISIGYSPFVKTTLAGVANVTKNSGNSGDSANFLKVIKETPDKWLGKKYDIIAFNAGLWDVAYRIPGLPANGNLDKVKGTVTASHEKYKENIAEIVKILKGTGAKLIWVNTTVVPENEPGRIKGDEVKYNEIAKQVMDENKIEIVDLYSISKGFDPSLSQEPGNVHFKSEGYKLLGDKVAEKIKSVIGK